METTTTKQQVINEYNMQKYVDERLQETQKKLRFVLQTIYLDQEKKERDPEWGNDNIELVASMLENICDELIQ